MQKALIERKTGLSKIFEVVKYLTPQEVQRLAGACKTYKKGKRDCLLILFLFQTSLRISEALSFTPSMIQEFEGRPILEIIGKGKKLRLVACPQNMIEKLKAYAYEKKIDFKERFFPINRHRAWQIINRAGNDAGLGKRVFCHLLRHSGSIERLRQTGNPKALKDFLGHSSTLMTMRYLSTLTKEDSLRIMQEVKFEE